jgi:hypothetical protein
VNIEREQAREVLGLELNALGLAGPPSLAGELEGARVGEEETPIYDPNGEVLFYRFSVADGGEPGYADGAARAELGAPLLAVSTGMRWDESALVEEATEVARSRGVDFDETRFVAFSFPKVGVQFLRSGEEALLLELGSWEPVPERRDEDRPPLEPSNFERWSLLEELPEDRREAATRVYEERVEGWQPALRDVDTTIIESAQLTKFKLRLHDWRELHYDVGNAGHHICFELHGQETNVWCVGASTQMLLAFYRYEYSQDRLAQALGLGTKQEPNGLPYARVEDVVAQLEALTSNALEAEMVQDPEFEFFRDEIDANRPLISFIPGHSRAVAGYIQYHFANLGQLPFRGLLVHDPWPPSTGVVTRWENWDTHTYQYGYRAHVKIVP